MGEKRAYLYTVPTVLIWASSPVVAKLLLETINVLQIILYSSFFAVLFLLITVIVKGKWKQFRKYSQKDYIGMFCLGFVGIFLQYFFLYNAIDFSTAQEAFIINYLWPILVALFAIPLLKEKNHKSKIIGLLVSFSGLFVIATRGDIIGFTFQNPFGNALALMTAIVVGLYFVLNKKYNYERYTSLLVYYASTLIVSIIAIAVFSTFPMLSIFELIGVIWTGLFIWSIAYVFWFDALKFGDTARISNIGYLTPFVSLIYIFLILNESILFSSVLGAVLIMAGIIIQHVKK